MASEFTKGEWDAHGTMVMTPTRDEMTRRFKEKGFPYTSRRICICEPSHYVSEAECLANARLIAASPDLLAACQGILPYFAVIGMGGEDVDAIRTAISKATGGTTNEC